MLLLRVPIFLQELKEAPHGGESGDRGPQQDDDPNFPDFSKGAVNHEQHREHEEFPDLRRAFADVTGNEQRNNGAGDEQREREFDGRKP